MAIETSGAFVISKSEGTLMVHSGKPVDGLVTLSYEPPDTQSMLPEGDAMILPQELFQTVADLIAGSGPR